MWSIVREISLIGRPSQRVLHSDTLLSWVCDSLNSCANSWLHYSPHSSLPPFPLLPLCLSLFPPSSSITPISHPSPSHPSHSSSLLFSHSSLPPSPSHPSSSLTSVSHSSLSTICPFIFSCSHLLLFPSLPLISGHCMQLSCFFFISRKWEQDRLEFQKKLQYFNAIDYPVQLLLFPEGGDLTPKTREISDKFADENNLPRYSYSFHPRTTGFNYIMSLLREGGLDAVYDISIGYPDILPKTEVDAWNGIYPKEVHFHIKSYEDRDIPEDEDGMKKWLKERWQEKEARMKDFYTHLEFKDPPVETDDSHQNGNVPNNPLQNGHVPNGTKHTLQRSPEVIKPHNIFYLLYSIFIIVSTNIILIVPWMYLPYFSFYMFCSFVFMMYRGYCDYSQYVMSFKEKEIEEMLRKSKYK